MTPFKEGYLARREGQPLSANRYDDGRRVGWRKGWEKADDEDSSSVPDKQPQGRMPWGRPTELYGTRT